MSVLDRAEYEGVVVQHVARVLDKLEFFRKVLLEGLDPGLHIVHEHPDLSFCVVYHQQLGSLWVPGHQRIVRIDLVLVVEDAGLEQDLAFV